jgi:hypothetical protein
MSIQNKFEIELRNKSGNLIQYLTPWVQSANWEWKRVGGCGNASIKLALPYRDIDFNVMDDIQIRNTGEELLSNGDMEFWAGGVPTGWTLTGTDAAVSKESGGATGTYCARLIRNGNTATLYQECHAGKGIDYWKGKTVILGAWVYITVANRGRITIDDGPTQTTSAYQNVIDEWKFITVRHTVDSAATYLQASCQVYGGDTSCYFDGVTCKEEKKLLYRGFISNINHSLSKSQDMSLSVKGYFDLLKTIVIQDTGEEKEYTSSHVHAIVSDITTNFIEANSDITTGTVDEDTFTVDVIKFKTSVSTALSTLSDILGNIEYGVDENLVFFWREESDTVRKKFFVGYDIEKFTRAKDQSELVNKIYLEGGDVSGSKYLRPATASGSISSYYLAESILVNSSITTDTVADAYLTSLLQQKSEPKYKLSFTVPVTTLRFEDVVPLGKISIHDDDYDSRTAEFVKWGTTANGGDNKKWGTVANGGDGVLWGGGGGVFQQQIEYVSYEMSNTPGYFNLQIYTGGSLDKFAAKVKQIEILTDNLRQR